MGRALGTIAMVLVSAIVYANVSASAHAAPAKDLVKAHAKAPVKAHAKDSRASTPSDGGSLDIVTDAGPRPYAFLSAGRITGFEVDLVNEIALRLGRTTEWSVRPTSALYRDLGKGGATDVAVAPSIAISPAMARAVDFSAPIHCSAAVIVTRAGGPTRRMGLAGRSVGVAAGPGSAPLAARVRAAGVAREVREYSSEADAFLALQLGKIAAWIVDRGIARDSLRRSGGAYAVGEALLAETHAVALRRGDRKLKRDFDRAFKSVLADGTYERLSFRYFGEDVRCRGVKIGF